MTLLHRKYLSNPHPLRVPTILHCDALLTLRGPHYYLILDWSRGGSNRVALDAYVVTPEYLMRVWEPFPALMGTPQYWTRGNNTVMARVHRTVVDECCKVADMASLSGYDRVSLLAHYIPQQDEPALTVQNYYRPSNRKQHLPDWL